MATKIVTKNSSTASAVPTASDLVQGELAVNVADKRLFTEDNAGAIVELGTNPYNFTANHNGSAKLATTSTGIDVTGTATMDGLSVSASAATANITSTSGGATLKLTHPSATDGYSIRQGNAVADDFRIFEGSKIKLNITSGGDISFYEDTGTTPKLFWDASAESLGIGTTANYSNRLYIQSDATGSLPTNQLIQQNDSNVITVKNGNNSATYSGIKLETRTTGASGWLIANEWKSTYLGDLVFKVRDAGTSSAERMRIDSSGNLLVGKSASSGSTAGHELLDYGRALHTVNASTVQILNRLSNDGTMLLFEKDGSNVGLIGTASGDLYIGTGDTALRFLDADDFIYPVSTATGTSRDNAIDLGWSGGRFDDIYATNSTIQTSDRNEKQDIAELSEAEQRVAVAAKGLLRKFRWKDSVAEKGDDARIHFGIIAQDLQAAFEAEGLDAGDYAMFISTTWTDEETNEEKTRMGVRYSELLAFIISAI